MPDLFPAIGFTLALGFELGPGQAFSIGSTWQSMGFEAGPSVGLTMAAIGFLLGSFGGVVLINQGIKRAGLVKSIIRILKQINLKQDFLAGSKNNGQLVLIFQQMENLSIPSPII